MKNIRETFMRLLIIYEHYSSGKLCGDYAWYSNYWRNSEPVIIVSKGREYYGTFPFVIGEMSYLFREWDTAEGGIVIYKPRPKLFEDEAMRHFLGLGREEYHHLFVPTFQDVHRFRGEELSLDATPAMVAKNIEAFLELTLEK